MLLTLMGNMVSQKLRAFLALSRYVVGRSLNLLPQEKPLPCCFLYLQHNNSSESGVEYNVHCIKS